MNQPNKTNHRMLIAYASQFGTTAEVAHAIGEVFAQNGTSVETKWVNDVDSLDGYDAVIVGSAIQYDRWMPAAANFVQAHQETLSKLPVAYFFTCLTLAQQSDKTAQKAQEYADKLVALAPQVKPVSVGRFAGAINYQKLSLPFRLLFKGLAITTGVKEGDYRNWEAIRAWANSMQGALADEQRSSLVLA